MAEDMERVVRPRPPNGSDFMTYISIGVDHHSQTVDTFYVLVSILVHGIEDISEGDTYTDPHRDVHEGLLTMISMIHEQLVEIGSDKLLIFSWD
jgi:hypothetical protein